MNHPKASTAPAAPKLPSDFIKELSKHYLKQQKRKVGHAQTLAMPAAFFDDPALVWQFYSYRRHTALKARPNRAHVALAEFAKRRPEHLAVGQNIDGLFQRAHHPPEDFQAVHGSLFDVQCTNPQCSYVERDNFKDPIVPALQLPDEEVIGVVPDA